MACGIAHEHQPAAQQNVIAGRMDVACCMAEELGQAAAGEIGADRFVIPQAVGAEPEEAQGGAGENDQHQQQPKQ